MALYQTSVVNRVQHLELLWHVVVEITCSPAFIISCVVDIKKISCLVIHMKKPLNYHCHMRPRWIIPVICLHALYVAALVCITRAIHHIDFRFREVKDLWRGILVSTSSIGKLLSAFAFLFRNFHSIHLLYHALGNVFVDTKH